MLLAHTGVLALLGVQARWFPAAVFAAAQHGADRRAAGRAFFRERDLPRALHFLAIPVQACNRRFRDWFDVFLQAFPRSSQVLVTVPTPLGVPIVTFGPMLPLKTSSCPSDWCETRTSVPFQVFRAVVRALKWCGWSLKDRRKTKAIFDVLYDVLRPRGLVRTRIGHDCLIVDADARGMAPHGLLFGVYEPALTSAIRSLLKPGDVFVDVGANIGYFSLLASREVGPNGRIVCIEPDPRNIRLLQLNTRNAAYRNILVHEVAAGDRDAQVPLFLDYRSTSRSTLTPSVLQHPGRRIGGIADVAMSPLDRLLTGLKPAVMKIDAEGNEALVLKGAVAVVAEHQPILITQVHQNGANVPELDRFLRIHDYSPYVALSAGELRRTQISELGRIPDIVALPRAREREIIEFCR